jgi:hypothetical protein
VRLSRITYAFSLLFAFFLAPTRGQDRSAPRSAPIIIHRSPISGLPTAVSNFTSEPPDIALVPRGEGARSGHLWVRTSHNGLHIAGKVDGGQPDFPHSKDQILSTDHVELWLAEAPDFDLPDIGWGNQFGEETLPKGEESCSDWAGQQVPSDRTETEKKCREWAETQIHYRPYFRRLFLRQWLMGPDFAVESFATPAYEEIQKRFSSLGDKVPEFMEPRGKPRMFIFPEQAGYSFEIFVPFEAFPPLSSLRPSGLYVLVDVFNSAALGKKTGVYSTSSLARSYGKPETFNALRLDPPFFFRLTPCDLPLMGDDKMGDYHPGWFLPGWEAQQNVSDTFIVVNDPAGYRYEPAGLSPTVRPIHYFWKSAQEDEWVCGPHLTYKKGGQSESMPDAISENGFETNRLPDGELLIKTGPRVWYSEFGSGQCGACPRTDLRVFELGKDMKLYPILSLGDVMNSPRLLSQDFTLSTDWRQITEYELTGNGENLAGSWSSTAWCLKTDSQEGQPHSHVYEKCGHKEKVQPPDPPVLKELRDWEN